MIAIAGRSAITPLGDEPRAIFAAVAEGKSGREIAGFEAAKYATVRGMRMYNRATQLAICAAKLALADAKLEVAPEDLGLVTAATYGHLDVLVDYDGSLVKNGMARTNAALMPFTIASAPGAQTALAIGAKAFSLTLSDGAASALDALAHAARWLEDERARVAVVVATFSAPPSLRAHLPPLDFGEGAAAFVLTRAPVTTHGVLGAYATAFDEDARIDAAPELVFGADALRSAFGRTFDLEGGLRVLAALDAGKSALVRASGESGSSSALVVHPAP